MYAKQLNKYKLKNNTKQILRRKILKESQYLYKCPGKHYKHMHKVVYNNKLEHKCTLIPLDPRLFYISPI